MSITSQLSADGQTLVIAVSGRFDFSSHKDFRSSYENVEAGLTRPARIALDTTKAKDLGITCRSVTESFRR